MPVKHVVFVHLHQVQVVFDDALGDVMPAGVNQDAAVGEPRRVHDLGSVDDILNRGNGLEYNRTNKKLIELQTKIRREETDPAMAWPSSG